MDYQRTGIKRLRELARQQHPGHDPEATRVFVTRILDMEAERRTLFADEHLQGIVGSAIAPGHAPGGTDIAREPLATLYDRGIRYHEGHEEARRWIEGARLPPRQLLAALIQARKLSGNGDQSGGGKMWVKSYDQIADNIGDYARCLGWEAAPYSFDCITKDEKTARIVRKEHKVTAFKDGKAIRDAAQAARAALIMLAKL